MILGAPTGRASTGSYLKKTVSLSLKTLVFQTPSDLQVLGKGLSF